MRQLLVLLVVASAVSCTGVASDADAGATGGGGGAATGGGGGAATGGGGGATTGGGGGSDIDAGEDAGTPDAGTDAGTEDAGTDDGGAYGLDARPANPTCIAPAPPPNTSGVTTQRAFGTLSFSAPLGLFNAPGDSSRVFVQERSGRIRTFSTQADGGVGAVSTFLDFATRVDAQGEGGFLGMAFHPQWPQRLEVFVSYTETSSPLRTVLSRFRSMDNGMTLSAASEEKLFTIEQPYNNHNGGAISFGPDGYLYLGLGDGGSGGDPLNAGQRLNTNLGKFIRLDVNVPAAQKYAIPPTNPYAADNTPCNLTSPAHTAGTNVRCAEIYALGFRNPWRWSFDPVSGELWVGDVGQGAWEEVDRVVLGGNYGWKFREGAHCYSPSTNCPTAGLIDPVVEYDRSNGYSITGGFTYRGSRIPTLVGKFVFGDYGSGRIWSVEPDGMGGSMMSLLVDTNFSIASFGQLNDGEVYALDIASGQVHQLVPSGMPPADTFPRLLSQTGCFQQSDPKIPVPALIPYEVNAALWSDGAAKERFFAIPDGETIRVGTNGDFDFPNGTVLVKTFSLGGKRIETRLFMKHLNGTWAGYTYEWNDTETEATLLSGAKTKQVGSQSWFFPSRSQCLQCHTAVAGRSLGLEVGQLNGDLTYKETGRVRNQLTTLQGLGFFTAALPGTLAKYESPFGTGPVESRARAYLHANCAGCHQQGAGRGPADFRYALSFKDTNTCDAMPTAGDLGITGARLIAPGSPTTSLVSRRIHALNAFRMPPLATSVVDVQGAALVDQWISSVTACPP